MLSLDLQGIVTILAIQNGLDQSEPGRCSSRFNPEFRDIDSDQTNYACHGHEFFQQKQSYLYGSHPLLSAVVLGRHWSIRCLRAEGDMFLQGGFLVEGSVAHMLVYGVDGHFGNVLSSL